MSLNLNQNKIVNIIDLNYKLKRKFEFLTYKCLLDLRGARTDFNFFFH